MAVMVQEKNSTPAAKISGLARVRPSWLGLAICAAIFFLFGFDANAATLFTDPATRGVNVDTTFEMILRVDTEGSVANALETTIVYPTTLLEAVSTSFTSSIITVWAEQPVIDGVAGTVRLSGGRPSPGFSGIREVVRVTFRARAVGEAAVTMRDSSVLANDGSGTELLQASRGSRFTITIRPPPPPPPPEPIGEEETETPTQTPEPTTPTPESQPQTQTPTQQETGAETTTPSTQPTSPETTPSTAESTTTTTTTPSGSVQVIQRPSIEGETAQAETTTLGNIISFLGFGASPSESSAVTIPPPPASCADGIDNDNDGHIDFPNDPGCSYKEDGDEGDAITTVISLVVSEEVAKNVEKAISNVQKNKVYQALDVQVVNNPVVEAVTAQVSTPVLVTAAAANVAVAANMANILIYLQALFTQPLLLFTRRKRKEWGQVYSSLTKLPVDLAPVRLFDEKTGRLIQTRVTDRQGRYLFITDPGTYKISVNKAGFEFPSALLKGQVSDLDFEQLYHGGALEVTSKSTTIARPIPLDPQEKSETPKAVIWRRRRRKIQKAVAWSGPILAMGSVVINPTLTTVGLLGAQFVMLGLFKRLAHGKLPRSWATVVDSTTGASLSPAVVRIFENQFNKLLDTQITDKYGRYAFLVGKGTFYITVEKPGYIPYRSSVLNLASENAKEIIKQSIRLTPLGKSTATTAPSMPTDKTLEEAIAAPVAPIQEPIVPTSAPPPEAVGVPTVQNPSQADLPETPSIPTPAEEVTPTPVVIPQPPPPEVPTPPPDAVGVPTVQNPSQADLPEPSKDIPIEDESKDKIEEKTEEKPEEKSEGEPPSPVIT